MGIEIDYTLEYANSGDTLFCDTGRPTQGDNPPRQILLHNLHASLLLERRRIRVQY